MKNTTLLIFTAIAFSTLAHAEMKKNFVGKAAVKAVVAAFGNEIRYEGRTADRSKCEIKLIAIESTFGGVRVEVASARKTVSFEIASSDVQVVRTEKSDVSGARIIRFEKIANQSEFESWGVLEFRTFEDSNDFELTVASDLRTPRAMSCFVSE